MKATLKYTNCLNDGRRVFSVLSRNDVQILNKECLYGVEVVKISAINWDIMAIENLFGIFLLIVR